ncbi:MAG: polyamine aminopropyltransferase [Methylococcaceae bacterium]|nr:MAG: polyamine aminopropyltransferase [Methylococcaceae bacterium]
MPNTTHQVTEVYAKDGSALSLTGATLLHQEQSAFQHIEIYQTASFGKLMVLDGCFMVTDRENFLYHEMMTHPALYTHPDPRTVCIIGGGDCGSLKEVLKHPEVRSAVQIEIDERVTRLAEQYFPELCSANHDPRATLKFIDGLKWVKEAAPGSVDIIIVDSTDPVGPAEGLFNAAFYRDCLRALGDNGILVQQSESPLFHLELQAAMHGHMRSAGFAQTRSLFFPQFIYPSGWWSATLAGKGDLTQFRRTAALLKPFATEYYNADIHQAAFAMPEFFKRRLQKL